MSPEAIEKMTSQEGLIEQAAIIHEKMKAACPHFAEFSRAATEIGGNPMDLAEQVAAENGCTVAEAIYGEGVDENHPPMDPPLLLEAMELLMKMCKVAAGDGVDKAQEALEHLQKQTEELKEKVSRETPEPVRPSRAPPR